MGTAYSKVEVRFRYDKRGIVKQQTFAGNLTLVTTDSGGLTVYEHGPDDRIRKITGWAVGLWLDFTVEIGELQS